MGGARGQLLRASALMPGIHPDLLHRFDWLLTGLYRGIAELVPSAQLPTIPDPNGDWLLDMADLAHEEQVSERMEALRVRGDINTALVAMYQAGLTRR